MDNKDIMEQLSTALDKYGEAALVMGSKETLMKKGAEVLIINKPDIIFKHFSQAFLKAGDILDINKNSIIGVIPFGKSGRAKALVVGKLENNNIALGAFYREGIIKQHGAKKAIEKVLEYL